MSRRPMGAMLVWLLVLCATARAQPPVSLQLVLAVDASGSVDTGRFTLQKQGYAAAFRSPEVQAAIRGTAVGAIAVMMTQWTGPAMHADVVGWTRIDSASSADRFAAAVNAAPRALRGGGTSISGAIDHAMALFPACRWKSPRRLIDVSGDGINNRGRPVEAARDDAVKAGIVINGLPILALDPELDDYYRRSVIGGPGAFLIVVHGYTQFAEAIRKKLVVEIAGRSPPARAAEPPPAQPHRVSARW